MTGFYELFRFESLIGFLLIAFRIGGIFISAPILNSRSVPRRLKVGLVIMMALLLVPIVPNHVIQTTSHLSLVLMIIGEVTIGLLIGFTSYLVFAAIQMGGEMVGNQVGFGMSQIFDPTNQDESSVVASFMVLFGSLLYLHLDGHHLILSGVTRSFSILPLGQGFNLSIATTITDFVAKIFIISIQITAPILVVMTLLNFVFGLVTKVSPQLNIFFNLGFILSPIVGLLVLLLSLPLFRVLMTSLTEQMGPDILRLLHDLKGI